MGIVGKVKRLDARPFDSASPSRTVPSRVGVAGSESISLKRLIKLRDANNQDA